MLQLDLTITVVPQSCPPTLAPTALHPSRLSSLHHVRRHLHLSLLSFSESAICRRALLSFLLIVALHQLHTLHCIHFTCFVQKGIPFISPAPQASLLLARLPDFPPLIHREGNTSNISHSFRCLLGNTLVHFATYLLSLPLTIITTPCSPRPIDYPSTFLTLLHQESRSPTTTFPGYWSNWDPILFTIAARHFDNTLPPSIDLTIRHAILTLTLATCIIRRFTLIVAENTPTKQRRCLTPQSIRPLKRQNILLHDSARNITCRLPCPSRRHNPASPEILLQSATVLIALPFDHLPPSAP